MDTSDEGAVTDSLGRRTGPRHQYTIAEKRRVAEESLEPGSSVAVVSQRRTTRGTMNKRLAARTLALGTLALAMPGMAMAYIDPGTGAYVVQMLATIIGVVAFYIAHPIRLVKMLWGRFFKRK